jgi:hypothetical protein
MSNPRRRHHYRRNPPFYSGGKIFGLGLKDIAFAGVGFVAPGTIISLINSTGMIPTSISGTALGRYALIGGVVAGTAWAGGKFLGDDAGKYLAIGGVIYLLATVIVDNVPSLFSGFMGATPGYHAAGRTLPRMGMGKYMGRYMGSQPALLNPANVPARLNANARF